MSVQETKEVAIVPWRSGDDLDLAYPSSMWVAAQVISGAAGGGVVELTVRLEAALKRTNRLFSLEELTVLATVPADEDAAVRILGSAPLDQEDTVFGFIVDTLGTSIAGFAAPMRHQIRPFSLPFRHRAGGDLTIVVTWDGNDLSGTYHFYLWGWVWESDAFFTPTGPRKPW